MYIKILKRTLQSFWQLTYCYCTARYNASSVKAEIYYDRFFIYMKKKCTCIRSYCHINLQWIVFYDVKSLDVQSDEMVVKVPYHFVLILLSNRLWIIPCIISILLTKLRILENWGFIQRCNEIDHRRQGTVWNIFWKNSQF